MTGGAEKTVAFNDAVPTTATNHLKRPRSARQPSEIRERYTTLEIIKKFAR
jgi:hypothetical protein